MNFTFSASAFLWLLPAALAPVLIHFLLRQKPRRLVFPAAFLLERACRQAIRRDRLKRWLLLVLRTAAVLLLVFLFARPFLRGVSGETGPARVAFVVDGSLSMRFSSAGHSRMDRARALLPVLAAGFGPADQFLLLRAGRTAEKMFPLSEEKFLADPAGLAEAAARLSAEMEPCDLTLALAEAYRALGPGGTRVRSAIVVFSDQARHLWNRLPDGGPPGFDPKVPVALVGLWPRLPNAAAISAEIAGVPLEGDRLELRLTYRDFGAGRPIPVEVFLRGSLSHRGLAEKSPAILGLPAGPAGPLWGSVRLAPDSLAEDDEVFFVGEIMPRQAVLLLDGEPGPSSYHSEVYYLAEALRSRPGLEVRIFPWSAAEEMEKESPPGLMPGLIVVANPPEVDGRLAQALARRVSAGSRLLVFLGSHSDPARMNPAFLSLLPARIGGPQKPGGAGSRIARLDLPERMTSLGREADFSTARFRQWRTLLPEPGAVSRLVLENGEPIFVESRDGRVGLFGSSADPDQSNFCLKPAYVALWNEWAAERPAPRAGALVGEPAEPGTVDGSGRIISMFEKPGIYWRVGGTGQRHPVPVNLGPDLLEESDPAPASLAEIRRKLPADALSLLDGSEEGPHLAVRLRQALFGRDAGPPVVLTLLAFLALEGFFRRRHP